MSAADKLQTVPGVGAATAKKLVKAGIKSPSDLAKAKPAALAKKAKIQTAVAKKIIAAAGKTGKKKPAKPARKPSVKVEIAEERPSVLLDILERITGKESLFTLDLEDVGLEMGERKLGATGNIKIKVKALG